MDLTTQEFLHFTGAEPRNADQRPNKFDSSGATGHAAIAAFCRCHIPQPDGREAAPAATSGTATRPFALAKPVSFALQGPLPRPQAATHGVEQATRQTFRVSRSQGDSRGVGTRAYARKTIKVSNSRPACPVSLAATCPSWPITPVCSDGTRGRVSRAVVQPAPSLRTSGLAAAGRDQISAARSAVCN
jgi:hypothetical protein